MNMSPAFIEMAAFAVPSVREEVPSNTVSTTVCPSYFFMLSAMAVSCGRTLAQFCVRSSTVLVAAASACAAAEWSTAVSFVSAAFSSAGAAAASALTLAASGTAGAAEEDVGCALAAGASAAQDVPGTAAQLTAIATA